ncbi:hypothetical protein QF022_003581 [Vogesella perlucida]|nr:hypothetical protein [Vogesella perlucida]
MLPALAACLTLRQQPVRDLAYLLTAPPPWHSGAALPAGSLLGSEGWPQLRALDANPAPLLAWLAAHPTRRLGLYAEALLAFWCRLAPHIELVAANLPVRVDGRTVGEFDFLLRINGQPCHLETASKFYLQLAAPPHALVGPGLRDAWWLKYRKLGQQLALSRHPAAVLPPGFDEAPAYSLLTGWLFFPDHPAPLDAALSEAACRGWWRRQGDTWPAQPGSRWRALPRLQWLAPARCEVGMTLDETAMRASLAGSDTPWLLAELQAGADGDWYEVARGFVVPDSWPQPALLTPLLARLGP